MLSVAPPPSDAPRLDAADLIGCRAARTLWGLFCERVFRTPEGVAYRDYDAAAQIWRDHTWRAMARRVDRFRTALAKAMLRPGDRVGILLPNGIDWVSLDLAAHASGLVVVALYPHDSAANNAYILGHSDARLVLLDTQARWQALAAHRAELPSLQCVWVRDGAAIAPAPAATEPPVGGPAAEISVRGLTEVLAAKTAPPPAHPVEPNALSTLVYTSGTTGRPKGVMLSHFALLWNAEATAKVIPPRPDDVFLSILPLAHAFERTLGYYLPMMGGSTVAYARSPQDLREDLTTVRPTVLLGVPRLFERMYMAIRANVAANVVKRNLLHLAVSLGWRRVEAARHGSPLGLGAQLLWPLLARFVVVPVMAAFGGRLRVAVSGGAPLDVEVARFLLGIGLPLVEGYGLTEAAPVVTATSVDENVPGSVGRPLQGIELKVTDAGELMLRSPSVMLGYWKDDAQTACALDPDGWLATGDLADIQNERVFVRGRLKDMIVLSIGEKINPNVVEAEIARDPLFEQVALVGNGRPSLAALIVPNGEAWRRFAQDHGANPDLPNSPAVKGLILARIEHCLAAYPRHAQVRAVHLTLTPWTIEAGLLTPTLKVKRNVLGALFAKEIETLYGRQ